MGRWEREERGGRFVLCTITFKVALWTRHGDGIHVDFESTMRLG